MPHSRLTILVLLVMLLASCDKTPQGVMSLNSMADLIVDLQLAEAYIESHYDEFADDSSKLVLKQSIFKKHGITQQDYDSSMVWYAHNMEDYTKAYDKAVGKLQQRYDRLSKGHDKGQAEDLERPSTAIQGAPTHNAQPRPLGNRHPKTLATDASADSADLWTGQRSYMLTPGARRGFITFNVVPPKGKSPGDRYQLAYWLERGGNEFKVSLNVDYTDGSTSQIARVTNSDGWVTVDVQSDSTRKVRRVYGYVSYDIKRGSVAYVDSLMLMRTRLNKNNYGFFNAQRLLERKK